MNKGIKFFGFSPACKAFLETKKLQSIPSSEKFRGLTSYDGVPNINYYTDVTGKILYKDYLQLSAWKIGSCLFAALWDVINDGPAQETLWDKTDINFLMSS